MVTKQKSGGKNKELAKVAFVVLGAGESIRFKGGTKQLAKIGGRTMIQNALDLANGSKADYSYLILGHEASKIAALTCVGRAQIIFNKDYKKGLSSSLKCAISNLRPGCEGALFMVADLPLIKLKDLNLMIESFRKEPATIVALSYENEPRNPVIIPKSLFPEILAGRGDIGARKIILKHADILRLIEIEDENTFLDVDTRSDLRKVVAAE